MQDAQALEPEPKPRQEKDKNKSSAMPSIVDGDPYHPAIQNPGTK
jgi:hypothetical protein